MAAYAVPGSAELGHNIAEQFALGYNTVMLENHGCQARRICSPRSWRLKR